MQPIETFTSLDLEFNQPSKKIIQIGACVGNISTGKILDRLSVFINPEEKLNPEIIHLTGITQKDVDKGVTLEDGYQALKNMHEHYSSFVNALTWGGGDSQALYDQLKEERTSLLRSWLRTEPDMWDWCFGRRWIDVKTIFVSWRVANSQPIQGGLAKSMTKVGLNFEGRKHNALDDSMNTFRMYVKMLEMLKDKK